MKLLNKIMSGLTATVCCVMVSGCTDNNDSDLNATGTLHPSFHAISGISKALVNGTEITASNDKINSLGLYLTTEDHVTYPEMTDRSSVWTFTNDGWKTPQTIALSNQKALLYAYSPVSLTVTEGNSNTDEHTVPVTIDSELTFNGANTWECNGTDYLYGSSRAIVGDATVVTVNNKDNNPKVYLQHAMAQVVIKMQSAAGRPQDMTYDYVKSITFSAEAASAPFLSGTGDMKIKNGAFTSLTENNTLRLTPLNGTDPVLSGPSGNPSVVAYGLVAPVTFTIGDKITITIVLGSKDSDANDRIQSVTHDTFKVDWEKGNKYIYNLTLGNHNIVVNETLIEEWTEVPSNGEMTPDGF